MEAVEEGHGAIGEGGAYYSQGDSLSGDEGIQEPTQVIDVISQLPPRPGDENVLTHVLADIIARAEAGRSKYGTYLQTNNGRDALLDAYQEAIDLVMYLRQALLERDEDA